jgi:hypothetical protein
VIVDTVVTCDCGFEARARHEDELVAVVRRHAWEAHGMRLTVEQALLLAFRAELDKDAPTAISRTSTRSEKEER